MTDYTFKFPDEATARAALFDADGNPLFRDVLMPVIVTKPTGKMIDTPEGPQLEMTVTPGFHVNVYDVGAKDALAQWWVDVSGTPSTVRA